jgi:hypothetical protein
MWLNVLMDDGTDEGTDDGTDDDGWWDGWMERTTTQEYYISR